MTETWSYLNERQRAEQEAFAAGVVFDKWKADDACLLSSAETFTPSDWTVVLWPWLPKSPQAAPLHNFDADRYLVFDRIPNLRRKSQAKTAKGQEQFKTRMELLYKDRRTLYLFGTELLRLNSFFKQSESIYGEIDRRTKCPRCGSNCFQTKRSRLICHDCEGDFYRLIGVSERKYRRDPDKQEEQEPTETIPARKRVIKTISKELFLEGVYYEQRFEDIHSDKTRHAIACSYACLVDGWLPRDVRAWFSDDSEAAIERRATRLRRSIDRMLNDVDLPEPPTDKQWLEFFARIVLSGFIPSELQIVC